MTSHNNNFVQSLESRVQFSATFEVVDRVLIVNGTDAADTVQFNLNGSNLIVNLNGQANPVPTNSFERIEVYAGGGNDRVFRGFSVATPMYVLAGPGNDSVLGTDGNDTLTGGPGRDTLIGNLGDDRINGGPGNDLIRGNNGRDRLYGDGGDDFIEGNNDADRLFGGDGNDQLIGGGSIDRIFGEAGDDQISGGSAIDQIDGGTGSDTVSKAESDVLVDVEATA